MSHLSIGDVSRILTLTFFGGLLVAALAILVAKLLSRNARSPNQSTATSGGMRSCGRARPDPEWRIQSIVYEDSSGAWYSEGLLAHVTPLGFLFGIVLALCTKNSTVCGLGFGLAGVSFVAAWGNVLFKARKIRRGWKMVEARCVDRELRHVWSGGDGEGGWTWKWRIVCEYDYAGSTYRVTPTVFGGCVSEKRAQRCLEKRIAPNGVCKLRINPTNLLQAELFGRGVADMFLYWPRELGRLE